MPSSGTKTFTFPIDDLVQEALQRVGGEWSSAEEQRSARLSLNLLLEDLHNRDIPLFSIQQKTVSLAVSTNTYTLGAGVMGVIGNALVKASGAQGNERSLSRYSFLEFNNIPDKTRLSDSVNSFTVLVSAQDTVKLQIYPTPTTTGATQNILYYGITRPDTVNSNRETLDASRKYFPAICAGLAFFMSFKRQNISPEYRQQLEAEYEKQLQRAFENDRERVSFFAVPHVR